MTRILLCLAMLAKGSNAKRLWLGVGMASGVLLALASPSRAATVTVPGGLNINPLDIATVTTGGTAVTAVNAGHRSAGGWIQNPWTATVNLCINEVATASGTTSAGSLVCIIPGQTYNLTPSPGLVSVISSDSSHAFAGYGYQQ